MIVTVGLPQVAGRLRPVAPPLARHGIPVTTVNAGPARVVALHLRAAQRVARIHETIAHTALVVPRPVAVHPVVAPIRVMSVVRRLRIVDLLPVVAPIPVTSGVRRRVVAQVPVVRPLVVDLTLVIPAAAVPIRVIPAVLVQVGRPVTLAMVVTAVTRATGCVVKRCAHLVSLIRPWLMTSMQQILIRVP